MENKSVFDSVSIKEYVRAGNATAALILPPDAYRTRHWG